MLGVAQASQVPPEGAPAICGASGSSSKLLISSLQELLLGLWKRGLAPAMTVMTAQSGRKLAEGQQSPDFRNATCDKQDTSGETEHE